jgi:hypothetical protein
MSMQEVRYLVFSKSLKSRETEISVEQPLAVDDSTEMSVVEAFKENVSILVAMVTRVVIKVVALLHKVTGEKIGGPITRTEETIEVKAEARASMNPPVVAAAGTTTEVAMSGKSTNIISWTSYSACQRNVNFEASSHDSSAHRRDNITKLTFLNPFPEPSLVERIEC